MHLADPQPREALTRQQRQVGQPFAAAPGRHEGLPGPLVKRQERGPHLVPHLKRRGTDAWPEPRYYFASCPWWIFGSLSVKTR